MPLTTICNENKRMATQLGASSFVFHHCIIKRENTPRAPYASQETFMQAPRSWEGYACDNPTWVSFCALIIQLGFLYPKNKYSKNRFHPSTPVVLRQVALRYRERSAFDSKSAIWADVKWKNPLQYQTFDPGSDVRIAQLGLIPILPKARGVCMYQNHSVVLRCSQTVRLLKDRVSEKQTNKHYCIKYSKRLPGEKRAGESHRKSEILEKSRDLFW